MASPQTFTYERHDPASTTMYKLVQENWLSFQQQVEEDLGHGLPDFVVKEFEEYLRCGILAHGFLRAKCESCSYEMLIAFSCKKRGFCPSCGARRMSESAAHLVDEVLPHKAIRQWVLTFPIPIRLCLAVRPKIMARALDIAHLVIGTYYRKKAGLKSTQSKTGAVTLIQRFGGSLNLNIHFHQLFVDGCYELNNQKEPSDFYAASAPTIAELQEVLLQIIKKITKYLERQKIIIKEENQDFQLPIDDEDTLSKLQASSVTYRFATGKSKGKKALVLSSVPDQDHNTKKGLVANNSGFSLHAGVAVKANEREKLERICRYIARPAVAEERLTPNENGDVIYRFKKPWATACFSCTAKACGRDDGTTVIKLTPMEFMERLVALVPRPRVHLTRFHSVLAPHYKYRKLVVPKPPPKLVVASEVQEPAADPSLDLAPKEEASTKRKNMTWARLLARVFKIDVETCPHCGGKVKIIAAIEEPKVIKKILDHLGLSSKLPTLTPARGPPLQEYAYKCELSQSFPEEF